MALRMPNKETNQAGAAGENAGRSNLLRMFVFILVVLLTAAGLVFGYFNYFSPDKSKAAGGEKPGSATALSALDLGDMVVNLAGPGSNRFLRAKITIEYMADKETEELVKEKKHQIIDTVLLTLRQKSIEDVKPPEATEKLKQELVTNINNNLNENAVQKIYFTEYIVQ